MKSPETMKTYRRGYRLLWSAPTVKKLMKTRGLKEPGKYKKDNQHGGFMYALPTEVNMSNATAGDIMYKAILSGRFSYNELRDIRKMFSFTYQIQGGEPNGNFKAVAHAWPMVKSPTTVIQPPRKGKRTMIVPTPREIKKLFQTEWDRGTEMSLYEWSRGRLATWFWLVTGARGTEDMKRLKKSTTHHVCHREAYGWTAYKGGRAKLSGMKKGSRPWKGYVVCTCKGGKHVPLPKDVHYGFEKDGNPPEWTELWHTECMLNCFHLILKLQWRLETQGVFRHWSSWKDYRGGRVGKQNVDDPVKQLCYPWIKQAGCNRKFSHNAGRYALAGLCKRLNVPYGWSFQIHGDNEDVWLQSYQKTLEELGKFKIRTQSPVPEKVTKALRKFANYFKLGEREPVGEEMSGELDLQMLICKKLGIQKEALAIRAKQRQMQASDSESEDGDATIEGESFRAAAPSAPRVSRRTLPQLEPESMWAKDLEETAVEEKKVKKEESDPEFEGPPPPPKRKRRKPRRAVIKTEPKEEESSEEESIAKRRKKRRRRGKKKRMKEEEWDLLS